MHSAPIHRFRPNWSSWNRQTKRGGREPAEILRFKKRAKPLVGCQQRCCGLLLALSRDSYRKPYRAFDEKPLTRNGAANRNKKPILLPNRSSSKTNTAPHLFRPRSRCPRFCSAARRRRIDANATSQSHRSTPTTPTTPPARGTRVLHMFLAFGSLPLPPSLSVALAILMPTSLRPLGARRRKDQRPHPWDDAPPPYACIMPLRARAVRWRAPFSADTGGGEVGSLHGWSRCERTKTPGVRLRRPPTVIEFHAHSCARRRKPAVQSGQRNAEHVQPHQLYSISGLTR